MGDENTTCGTCLYWLPIARRGKVNKGQCRRYAPVHNTPPAATPASYWCGEYRPRPRAPGQYTEAEEAEAEAHRDAYDRLCADYGKAIAWGMIRFAPGSPQWREFEECWQQQPSGGPSARTTGE